MKYNEIERLQQLAGIITEIKVNNPTLPFILKKTPTGKGRIYDKSGKLLDRDVAIQDDRIYVVSNKYKNYEKYLETPHNNISGIDMKWFNIK